MHKTSFLLLSLPIQSKTAVLCRSQFLPPYSPWFIILLKLLVSVPVASSDQSKAFRWKTRKGQCVVPGQVIHDGVTQNSIKPVKCDSEKANRGHWLWTEAGQVIWSEGCQKCIQSHKWNTPVQMHFCQVSLSKEN